MLKKVSLAEIFGRRLRDILGEQVYYSYDGTRVDLSTPPTVDLDHIQKTSIDIMMRDASDDLSCSRSNRSRRTTNRS